MILQMFARRYDTTKVSASGLTIDWHNDVSSLTAVISMTTNLDDVGYRESRGDLVVDVANSECCGTSAPSRIPRVEVPCKLSPGDIAMMNHSCIHKTTEPMEGSRWTLVVLFGFA